jgi:DNA-binding NarL/FixJ family response regulator
MESEKLINNQQATPGDSARRTLLLVEDDDEFRKLMRLSLNRNLPEVEILEATSLQSAHDIGACRNLNLVVTDIALIDGSGFDLIQNLRKLHSGIKCIVVSNYDENDLGSALPRSAIDAFIPKDRGMKALTDAILQVLKRP